MSRVEVQSEHSYQVEIDISVNQYLTEIKKRHQRTMLVWCDDISLAKISDQIDLLTHRIPSGEAGKNWETLQTLLNRLGELNFTRSDALIALGGGATTDLVGLAAALWLRGIAWYALPTTLAGAVDAAIGGKTAINSQFGKNLIGSFHSPQGVGIDLTFLESLSDRDLSAGMAEVIKCGFISDRNILDLLRNNGAINSASIGSSRTILIELIERSVAVKAKYVSADFKEGKLREALNFGHTLGHAIEQLENYQLRHGEAVALGMIFAMALSEQKIGLAPTVADELLEILQKYNLPTKYELAKKTGELLKLMQIDKKARGNNLRFIGITRIGEVGWMEDVSIELADEVICEVFG